MKKMTVLNMNEAQREAFVRRRELRALFGPTMTIEPGVRLVQTIVTGILSWNDSGRRRQRSISKDDLADIEVFRPQEIDASVVGVDDVIVEAVRVAGRDQLAGPVSSVMFVDGPGRYGTPMMADSAIPSAFEIALYNPHGKSCEVALSLYGDALVKAGSPLLHGEGQ